MSAAHTEGLLTVSLDEPNLSAYLVGQDRRAVARVINAGLRGGYGADARRLAACWNSFDGTSTEAIEANVPRAEISSLIAERDALNKELAAARTLLSDALETFDDNPREDHEVADRIRAFLKGAV